ncbi:hypothetical protein ASZ78_000709 [Callipepla squamata]|uniref:SOCS box domain-containing protein n=1 Tax=Callipepla squamata TaxID=9009 RepID=A0A226N294_CALSU|nr:hypothetical protein ASZ78_000709 [Callipepla squamata]
MDKLPGPVTERLQISPKLDSEHPLTSPAEKYYHALVTGNLRSLQVLTDRYYEDVNLVFEISKNEMEWQVKSQAFYGLSGHAACVELLLEHQADPNLQSDEGLAPLHLCTTRNSLRCAELLLKHGAIVNQPSEDSRETALHVAARHGLYDHAHLYLKHGANVDARSTRGETALSLICRQEPDAAEDALQLCRLLVVHGAKLDTLDELRRSPLHEACGAANAVLVRFLLRRGADVNAIDYNGISPLGCVLQTAAFKQELRPHMVVQLLLNYGSQKIWPHAFAKVLRSCAAVPEIIEILINSYSQIPISEKWVEAVPEEVLQQHQQFYESLFRLSGTVRSLQHLCRSTIRKKFGSRCHCLIPSLPVPKPLLDYLLLEPEGVLL